MRLPACPGRAETHGVRVHALHHPQVGQHLRGAVVLEAHLDLDRRLHTHRAQRAAAGQGRLHLVADHLARGLGGQGARGVEAQAPLHHRALDAGHLLLHFLHRGVVAGDQEHGHAEMARQGRVPAALRHRDPVEPQVGQGGAGHGVGAHPAGVGGAGVVADEEHPIEGGVDAVHHAQRPGVGAHHGHVPGQPLQQQVLHVAVGVRQHELGDAGLAGGGHGRQRLLGHELAEARVLEPGGAELLAGHHPGDALHVDGDEQALAVRGPGVRRGGGSQEGGDQQPAHGLS